MESKEIVCAVLEGLPDRTLPDPDEISYYVLEKERKLYIDYDIASDLTSVHRMILRWNIEDKDIEPEKRKPIWIYIMSVGGDLDATWMLIDCIQSSETPVYTVNLGLACSAAGLIFLAGKQRFMTKNAKLVIHEGYAELAGDAVKVMDATENYKKDLKKMKDFIAQTTSIPRATIMKKRNNDWYLDAEFCLSNKACDRIVESLSEVL